jgi:hypothetical protein
MLAVAVFLLAMGAGVTKLVDTIRNSKVLGATPPKFTWNVVAFGIGIIWCLGWQVEVTSQLAAFVPALADHASRFTGVAGQVFTGVLVGALGGGWHEFFDLMSSVAKRTSTVGV